MISLKDWKKVINDQSIIIDIRTPQEYSSGHIRNSINLDFFDPTFVSKIKTLERNKEYFVYCKSGKRCEKVLSLMSELDFNSIIGLKGGIQAWIDAQQKVEQ